MVTSRCTRSSTAIAAIPLAGCSYLSAFSEGRVVFDVLRSRVYCIEQSAADPILPADTQARIAAYAAWLRGEIGELIATWYRRLPHDE